MSFYTAMAYLLYLGNEWKTRFETQQEMNQQLERQIIMLQDKVEEAKRNLKDGKNDYFFLSVSDLISQST